MADSDFIVANTEIIASRTGDKVWKVPSGVTCHLPDNPAADTDVITINAGAIIIEGTINGVGKGRQNGGAGVTVLDQTAFSGGGQGAGYGDTGGSGGKGSVSCAGPSGPLAGGPAFGDANDTTVYVGSSGGQGGEGGIVEDPSGVGGAKGHGGGGLILKAATVVIKSTAVIRMNGSVGGQGDSQSSWGRGAGGGGAGSGGTILIEAHRVIIEAGAVIEVNGGPGGPGGPASNCGGAGGGGGAGGRLKIRGFEVINNGTLSTVGGAGGSGTPPNPGDSGGNGGQGSTGTISIERWVGPVSPGANVY